MTLATSALTATRYVDASVAVSALDDALGFWTDTMGFVSVASSCANSRPWAIVADPETDQRLKLIERDHLPFALSFEVEDLDACVGELTNVGGNLHDRGTYGDTGIRWVLVRDPWAVPMLLRSNPDEPSLRVAPADLPELDDVEMPLRLGRMVDTVVPVSDLAAAVGFWTHELGFEPVDRGEMVEYTSLLHPATGQVVCLIENGNQLRWWVSIECDDLERAIERFTAGGGTIEHRGRFETGFRWALGTAAGGTPVTLHTSHPH